jgi:predicted CoA-binding protein
MSLEEDPMLVSKQTTLIKKFIEKRSWAIVGASEDTTKYGNKIFRDLKNAGYHGKAFVIII